MLYFIKYKPVNNLTHAGTGKTVIAAFDYRNFRKKHPGEACRLLFVAHREEILTQSRDTFQGVLRDLNFGELFVGNYVPENLDYLFISVQTMNSQKLYEKLNPDYYDFIIVDEFHHASAPTYQRFLNYFKPKILLGLTATPERMDGASILDYFDNRIAAEIRLPEAINRKLLSPFQYFGVTDTVDLSDLKWARGGYEKSELTNLYSLNREVAVKRANHIIESLDKYVTDMDTVKGLGFCVSKEHTILNNKRVNKVNLRKEFFRVPMDELEELVNSIDPTAEFTRTILAEEFRQSESTSEVYTTSYIPDEEDEE